MAGPGLAFIAYPRAVAMMPLPQLWAIFFFIMIIFLGLDSEVNTGSNTEDFSIFNSLYHRMDTLKLFLLMYQFVYHEALVTAISDMYPSFFQIGHRRKFLLLFISLASFLVGLLMVTEVRVTNENTKMVVWRKKTHICSNCNFCLQFFVFLFHTQGGLYVFQLFDYYACSGMTLLTFAILQSICVGWVYGKSFI